MDKERIEHSDLSENLERQIRAVLEVSNTGKLITTGGDFSVLARRAIDEIFANTLRESKYNYPVFLDAIRRCDAMLRTSQQISSERQAISRKILRSIRGKAIYRANRAWVEKEYGVDTLGDLSATNVAHYAATLKKFRECDVYAEASQIEMDKLRERVQQKVEEKDREINVIISDDLGVGTSNKNNSSVKLGGAGVLFQRFKDVLAKSSGLFTMRRCVSTAIAVASLASTLPNFIKFASSFIQPRTENMHSSQQKMQMSWIPDAVDQQKATHWFTQDIMRNDKIHGENDIPDVSNNLVDPEIQMPIVYGSKDGFLDNVSNFEQKNEVDERETIAETAVWSDEERSITSYDGNAKVEASLFMEKDSRYNYGKPGVPGGLSTLMWNSMEAITRFGSMEMKPGDSAVFTDIIGFGDVLKPGEDKGGGYVEYGKGACNAATVFGELFGVQIQIPGYEAEPLFVVRPGYVQAHDTSGDSQYYKYAYHGVGVAINETELGSLPFAINPRLPAELRAQIELDFFDSDPSNPSKGLYRPTARVVLSNLPYGTVVSFQRLSANRTEILQRVNGTKKYWVPNIESDFFEWDGSLKQQLALTPNIPNESEKVSIDRADVQFWSRTPTYRIVTSPQKLEEGGFSN